MNNIDKQYQALLQDILDNGTEKKDRTGTGTISVFGRQIRHNMKEGFPLLTTKKMHWKSVVTELLWFLRGDTNIKFLLDYDCHIWSGDAYKNYRNNRAIIKQYDGGGDVADINQFEEMIRDSPDFADEWGDLGPIYGAQWREWHTKTLIKTTLKDPLTGNDTYVEGDKWIDQIDNLIKDLKTNPDSRRLMVSAWNVGQLEHMVLPPCHYGFQCYVREGKYLSLMWNQRSVDTFLGLPFNIASYGLLLEIIAKEVNMIPDQLIGNLGDVHLYNNHIEQAIEQITRTPYELPSIQITERNWYLHAAVKEYMGEKTLDEKLKSYRPDCFELLNYQSHPKIKAPLSN